ncbi:ankyrin repeat-containing protein At5g02620-like [Salvia miltiorrhiza]|uniref:ankyrin repeat-containing protein At5g02620-like n=1 Tax=Salvia miltiorrhiza TaxID=226208 RepID=UPI0025AB6ABF|nr:ankyrin repeat-containing protein At5g02620-like [Salvia miltiorrhiza]
MKRVVRGRSGRERYGPKWQNMESSSSEDEDVLIIHSPQTNVADNQPKTHLPKEMNKGACASLSHGHETMYRATLEGDCVAAEMLLEGLPSLCIDEITEEGDKALHVAAAMKHKQLVRKLVEIMSPTDLELLDGHGYTACCYAAVSGLVDIADLMIRKNPTLASARDRENKTPLYKAALRGNAKMVSYFLKSAQVEDLSIQEWFDLLLVTIRREMYDVALEILGSKERVATMRNDEGTALHLLARQRFFLNRKQRNNGAMRQDMQILAKKLWEYIQKLGNASAVELMKNPPILHDAAQLGNVELITMLTQTYPHLIWHTDANGYTIFHIAVKCRHEMLFDLINEIGVRKDSIAMSQDENGDNILHLATESAPTDRRLGAMPGFEMLMEMLWFERVKAAVPPSSLEMRNKDGHTPRELFSKRHHSLLNKSKTWIKNTADSCMLISTLIFTVAFASAFSVPGGYDQETGIPVLVKTKWFSSFVIFEALAMLSSACSIIFFLRIMMSSFEEVDFMHLVPNVFAVALIALSFSVFGAVSAFMSAYFLVYVEEKGALVKSVIIFVYVVLVSLVFLQNIFFVVRLPKRMFMKPTRHALFKPSVGQNRRRFN